MAFELVLSSWKTAFLLQCVVCCVIQMLFPYSKTERHLHKNNFVRNTRLFKMITIIERFKSKKNYTCYHRWLGSRMIVVITLENGHNIGHFGNTVCYSACKKKIIIILGISKQFRYSVEFILQYVFKKTNFLDLSQGISLLKFVRFVKRFSTFYGISRYSNFN